MIIKECLVIMIVFTIIILTVAIKNPLYVVGDYPPAIIKRCEDLGLIEHRDKRFTLQELIKKLIAFLLFILLFGYIVYHFNEARSFKDAFLTSFIIWFVVTWYDAFIIDCLLFCHFKRLRIPGTEDMKEYQDYWFHIKGSLRGTLIGIPACLLIGLFVTLL